MNDSVLGIIVCVIVFALGYSCGNSSGYEEGQIDAMNGKIKYEAVIDTVYIQKPE